MRTILVVEDNPANQELLAEMLERWGYAVLTASNGREALTLLTGNSPDLMLVDIQMPELDGYGLLRHLRASSRFAETPVVALTAFAMQGDREAILARGFDGYLTKPIDSQSLRSEIETALQRDAKP